MSNPVVTPMDDSVLWDTVQTANYLQMSTFYVTKHSSGGVKPLIPYVKFGNRLRFKPSDVQDFIAARKK